MMLRKRFYKDVTVTDDLGIALDGRPIKTPMKAALNLPTPGLAKAVAAEWDAQGEKINPATMLFTKFANTAIDRVRPNREQIVGEVVEYANSDLVCYRATTPDALVTRHLEAWDPIVDWARVTLDAPFVVTTGVIHTAQPDSALRAHEAAIARLNDFELSAFYSIMTITGSALIATRLAHGAMTAEAAWSAAHVDEDFQIAQWGEDDEAKARRLVREREFMDAVRFLSLAKSGG